MYVGAGLHVCLCITCELSTQGDQKKTLHPLELLLQVAVRGHEGAGN